MPVIPYQTNLFQNRKNLYQFLSDCQNVSIEKNHPQIVSISTDIPAIDPLAAIQAIALPNQPHFYFEKRYPNQGRPQRNERIAIAAIGTAQILETRGSSRFQQTKRFIQTSLLNSLTTGATHSEFSGLHFFCSFAFFDQTIDFKSSFSAATIFIPRWQITRQGDRCILVVNLLVTATLNIAAIAEEIWQEFQAICAVKYELFRLEIHHPNVFKRQLVTSTERFKTSILSTLNLIQQNGVHKIVLANALDVISPIPFHLVYSLNNLRQLYPDCYLFSVSNGKGQTFMGASPERLLSIRDRQLATDALAGSARRGRSAAEDADLANNLFSSEKEMHEHQVVRNFITRHLSQLGLTPQVSPARLLQLSNIQHLQTLIQAQVPDSIHLLDILETLHPTPAVAGDPREIACDYIRDVETFERSLYAAPVGWVDHQGNGEFAVGIRSALIDGCHARLYAGAGIVAGSNPDKELAEVQLKLQTLLTALV